MVESAERSAHLEGERFWAVGLDEGERRVLEVGQGRLELAPRVLVVGGGIIGVATALACQDAGLGPVQLLEAATLGSGATGGSAGLLQPEPHHGRDAACLVGLARVSLIRWRQLERATPGGLGLVDHDWIGLPPGRPEWVADPPPTLRRIEPDEVARRLPALAPPGTVTRSDMARSDVAPSRVAPSRAAPSGAAPSGAALIPDQARLNPLRALARLARRLEHIATGVTATAASTEGRRLTSVATSSGTIRPATVVFATGLPPQLEGLDIALPADRIKGHLLVTEPADLGFSGTVDDVATRVEDGRLLAGGTLDGNEPSPAVQDEVIDGIHRRLVARLPAAADLAITHQWCCWRPHHPDDLPVIDRLAGLDNAWLSSGHYRTGVLLAPATAEILVEWIQTSHQPEVARPFGLARFR